MIIVAAQDAEVSDVRGSRRKVIVYELPGFLSCERPFVERKLHHLRVAEDHEEAREIAVRHRPEQQSISPDGEKQRFTP